jgi:hypothetical protein
MQPNQISPIIPSPDGYRILKMISKESAGQRELNDPNVQQSIRENLRNAKDQLLRGGVLRSGAQRLEDRELSGAQHRRERRTDQVAGGGMRAFVFEDRFSLDALKLAERPVPKPGPRQALVRLRANSLNYRDLVVASGGYGRQVKLPLIPLSDGAGEVVEVGPQVTRVKPGRESGRHLYADAGWRAGP